MVWLLGVPSCRHFLGFDSLKSWPHVFRVCHFIVTTLCFQMLSVSFPLKSATDFCDSPGKPRRFSFFKYIVKTNILSSTYRFWNPYMMEIPIPTLGKVNLNWILTSQSDHTVPQIAAWLLRGALTDQCFASNHWIGRLARQYCVQSLRGSTKSIVFHILT